MAKFSKPPLTSVEKERLANKFIKESEREKTRPIYLRGSEALITDIRELMSITGLSMNAICLEILRPAIKKKLREVKEE